MGCLRCLSCAHWQQVIDIVTDHMLRCRVLCQMLAVMAHPHAIAAPPAHPAAQVRTLIKMGREVTPRSQTTKAQVRLGSIWLANVCASPEPGAVPCTSVLSVKYPSTFARRRCSGSLKLRSARGGRLNSISWPCPQQQTTVVSVHISQHAAQPRLDRPALNDVMGRMQAGVAAAVTAGHWAGSASVPPSQPPALCLLPLHMLLKMHRPHSNNPGG